MTVVRKKRFRGFHQLYSRTYIYIMSFTDNLFTSRREITHLLAPSQTSREPLCVPQMTFKRSELVRPENFARRPFQVVPEGHRSFYIRCSSAGLHISHPRFLRYGASDKKRDSGTGADENTKSMHLEAPRLSRMRIAFGTGSFKARYAAIPLYCYFVGSPTTTNGAHTRG
jgi:hypothetical protein